MREDPRLAASRLILLSSAAADNLSSDDSAAVRSHPGQALAPLAAFQLLEPG